ncbi:PA3496 family putative envelope integrity protein [Pseudomonas mangiferae]|uniref:Leucyl-tRNA synthetase n=1 Tax=Pseudomonas mangiferae TaxID=2593654 RepID=A0A553GW44_9PSED|nr:hypothetical protein [Pseudomonas mangiferae]TRX73734.1 hypothetical protein FM069_16520 [Pseudomonas mangiferae]
MSADKDEIGIEDEFVADDAEEVVEKPVEVSKTNLTKRRVIDNLLEERRLKRQLADYDFDL